MGFLRVRRFKRNFLNIAGFVGALLLLAGTGQAQPKLDLYLASPNWPAIALNFSVDCGGNRVFNMAAQDFRVFDDGVEITDFSLWCPDPTVRCAISVSLVFDASGSMTGDRSTHAKLAGHAFIDMMDGVVDEAAVIWFGQTVTVAQPMTTVKPALHLAVDALPAAGATAVWDGIHAGVTALVNDGNNPCRMVVAMTDGRENASTRTVAEIITLANRHRIRVFTIGLGTDLNATELEMIALLTGGRFYIAQSADQLPSIYQEISTRVLQGFQECVLTYDAPCADGNLHDVVLQLPNFCGGTDSDTTIYWAPLDSTTFVSLAVSLDSVTAPMPGVAALPLRIAGAANFTALPRFESTLLFDTSKLVYAGLQTDSLDALDSAAVLVTPVSGGIRLEYPFSFTRRGPTLATLLFDTRPGLDSSTAVVEIAECTFASPCITTFTTDGLVTGTPSPKPELVVFPLVDTLAFAATIVGDTSTAVLQLANQGGLALTVTSVTLSGLEANAFPLVGVLPMTLGPGARDSLVIHFVPSAAGDHHATLTIASTDPANGMTTKQLRGEGIVLPPPAISVTTTTVDFGWVMVDSTSVRQLTVSNTGGSVLRILAQDITGGDASLFRLLAPLPAEIAPSASADISIVFAPKSIGAKSATLSIQSNAPTYPAVDVTLIGNATTTSVAGAPAVPERPVITSAYPNPLRHATSLRIALPRAGEGSILIHDHLGRLLRKQSTGWLAAGTNTLAVSARDLAPGTYRITVECEGSVSSPALLVRY